MGASVPYEDKAAYEPVKGTNTTVDSMAMGTPQTWAMYYIGGEVPYSAKNKAIVSMIAQVMSKRLLDKVREEMGATYSIGASGQMSRIGDFNTAYQIAFPMKPEMKDEVFAAIDPYPQRNRQEYHRRRAQAHQGIHGQGSSSALEENSDWNSAIAATSLNGLTHSTAL